MLELTMCSECIHCYRKNNPNELGVAKCDAFPDGIPWNFNGSTKCCNGNIKFEPIQIDNITISKKT